MIMTCTTATKITADDGDSDEEELDAREKSKELFELCDTQRKGYLTNADLQLMKSDLSLSDAQLNEVFASLDENKDGRLEIAEFCDGFGMFVAIATNHPSRKRSKKSSLTNCSRTLSPIREHVDDPYETFLDEIGCRQFSNNEFLRSMWEQISEKNPKLLTDFENFLGKAASEMETAKEGFMNLQVAFSTQRHENDKHLRQMYESLEKKLATATAELLSEESAKGGKSLQQLEQELKLKRELLENLKNEHDTVKEKVCQLKEEGAFRKRENMRLEKERDDLEKKLRDAEDLKQDIENECQTLSEECLKAKKRRETKANHVSSEISIEEELIAVEIEHLQQENKFLLDCKDIIHSNKTLQGDGDDTLCDNDQQSTSPMQKPSSDISNRRGSCLSKYFRTHDSFLESATSFEEEFENSMNFMNSTKLEVNPVVSTESSVTNNHTSKPNLPVQWKVTCKNGVNNLPDFKQYWKVQLKIIPVYQQRLIEQVCNCHITEKIFMVDMEKNHSSSKEVLAFKIIFIGDCGVGKTSFIQRFCDNTFRSEFQSTIGMDFQQKEVTVNDCRVLLKLWDTAGQERFRSLCKQYFRNVDGAIVMYDVTNETSYYNVREWMDNIKDLNEEGIVILLIGNKTDVESKRIPSCMGVRLAEEYGATFFETSVKTGINVQNAMTALAISLQRRRFQCEGKRLRLRDLNQKTIKKKWRC